MKIKKPTPILLPEGNLQLKKVLLYSLSKLRFTMIKNNIAHHRLYRLHIMSLDP